MFILEEKEVPLWKRKGVIMEKKEYRKPQIDVIAVEALGIMAGSQETLKKGYVEDITDDMTDNNGYFMAD